MGKRILNMLLSLCLALYLMPAEALGEEITEAETTKQTEINESSQESQQPAEVEEPQQPAETEKPQQSTEVEETQQSTNTEKPQQTEETNEPQQTAQTENSALVKQIAKANETLQQHFCVEGCCLEEGHEGECVLSESKYQTEADGEWVYGTLAAACDHVYSGGIVEVLRDIALESSITIQKALTITSADPTTPCKITYAAKDRNDCLLMISAEGVILADITLDGGREEGLTAYSELISVGYLKTSTLTMKAGTVLQNNDNVSTDKAAGGLRVHTSSTAVMEEGSAIRNCRGVAGGGVAVASGKSTLTLNGGVIENCQAFVGGGIYVDQNGGMLNLNSGAIRSNQARKTLEGMSYNFKSPRAGIGGGLCVFYGKITMMGSGCTIAENYSEHSGGGIYINNGILQMGNGSIVKNRSDGSGGGILVSPSITGSTSLTIFFGNNPRVTGNISGKEYFHDVYMDGMEDEYPDVRTTPITIGAPLWDSASIGVARWLRPDQDHPYRIVAVPSASYTITESDLNKFFSDDPDYALMLHEGNIVLANADVKFDNQGHGTTPNSQRVGDDRKVTEPDQLEEEGYEFGGWYKEPECETPWDFQNDTVPENLDEPLTLYAKWDLVPYAITYKLDGGENAADNPAEYTIESEDIILDPPTKEGFTFTGWTWDGEDEPQENAEIPTGSTGEKTFTAYWKKDEPPSPIDPPDSSEDDENNNQDPTPTPDPHIAPPSTPSSNPSMEPSSDPVAGPTLASTSEPLSKTGDQARIVVCVLCALAVIAGIVLVICLRRKRK